MSVVASKIRSYERFVMDRLAAHLGGAWEAGEDPPDAYLVRTSGTVAVEVSTLTQHVRLPGRPSVPRIGMDAGVLDLVNALNRSIAAMVGRDRYAVVVLRSPLENLRRFKRELARHVESSLAAPSEVSRTIVIAGNTVKISTHAGQSAGGKRVVAGVANRLSNPDIAQNAVEILSSRIQDKALKDAGGRKTQNLLARADE